MGDFHTINLNVKLIDRLHCDGCIALKRGDVGEISYCRYYGVALLRTSHKEPVRHNRSMNAIGSFLQS